METPATGMWGPGDYPADFVTIETLWPAKVALDASFMENIMASLDVDEAMGERREVRDAILDLAEDLDARGLVLVPEAQVMTGLRDLGGEIARNFTALGVPIPPDLAALIEAVPIDTADADLETGGE